MGSIFSWSFILEVCVFVSFRDERRLLDFRLGVPPTADELTSLISEAGSAAMPSERFFAAAPMLLLFGSAFFLLLRPKGQMAMSFSPKSVNNVSPPLARLPPRRQHIKIDSLERMGVIWRPKSH
jgi:hypothetical protein